VKEFFCFASTIDCRRLQDYAKEKNADNGFCESGFGITGSKFLSKVFFLYLN
jgi:hypothetical protein